jgi:WD40 repeat protein
LIEDNNPTEDFRDYFKKNSRIKEVSAHTSKIHSVAWSSDGRRLASGSFDKTVSIFQLDNVKLVSCNKGELKWDDGMRMMIIYRVHFVLTWYGYFY